MIDLHVHSHVSDGADSPTKIIQIAYEKGLTAVALTDHDSIEGIKEAELEANRLGVNLVKGIELSVDYGNGRLLHILGLDIDIENEEFLKAYNKVRIAREEGIGRVLNILNEEGIHVDFENLRNYNFGRYLDRQAITKYFVAKGICSNVPEVWRDYLDKIPYGVGELFQLDEAIEMISKAGGLSFLAHYNKRIGLLGYSKDEMDEKVGSLARLGLDGIELYYPSFEKEEIDYIQALIDKYNLIPCGGTDFHGSNRPEVTLGGGMNGFCVPDSVYANIKSRLNKSRD